MSAGFILRSGDQFVEARLGADGRVVIGGTGYTVTPIANGVFSVSDGTTRWQVAVAGTAENRWVSVNGIVATVEVERAGGRRRRTRTAPGGAMAAPMPATVVKIAVAPGQAVSAGETLLVLEAMKMELPVRAPKDGVVKALHCAQGELVQPGVALVDLE